MRQKTIALLLAAGLAAALYARLQPPALVVGQQAPALRLPDLAGQSVSLSDYRGKVVLLTFWATWCNTCMEEMPLLDRAYQKYRSDGFEILAPSVDVQGRAAVMPYVARLSPSFKILLAGPLGAQKYGVRGLPASFLIDSSGTLVQRYAGPVTAEQLENDIVQALKRRPS